jgi:hypothetical protein
MPLLPPQIRHPPSWIGYAQNVASLLSNGGRGFGRRPRGARAN